jgi:hypothetical protein
VPLVNRTTFLQATLGGLPLDNVLSARVSLGFDLAIAEASVVVATEPLDGTYNDILTISMGAGVPDSFDGPGADGGNGNVLRFTGLLKQYDRTLYPRSITLVAKGPLSRAAEYKPFFATTAADAQRLAALQSAGVPGLLLTGAHLAGDADPGLETLLGSGPATDQNIVLAALERVPDLDPNIATIDGTGTDLGGLPPNALCWGFNETALAFIQRVDSASLGFRTFESIGGSIFRAQVGGWPGSQASAFTFTEGVDIFEGHSTRTILELKNVARVDGYDYGIGAGVIMFIADGSGGDSPKEIPFSTTLAGRVNAADDGPGFACEDIAAYLLKEWNRELVRLTLTTPRDDIIGPGQTHLITTATNLPDRLGTAEPLWVQRVDIGVDEKGQFSQTITYLGGGVADGFDTPIDWGSS